MVTPVPKEEFERTEVPFILKVLPEAKLKLSDEDQPTPEYQFKDLSVAPRKVMPPPWAVISVGVATTPSSIFLSATVMVVEFIVVKVPWTLRSPWTLRVPPMPTPPETTNAPAVYEPDPVLSVIETALVKVLIPAKLCDCVETKPVDPVPANGIFNVCVDPDEENAGTVPE